MKLKKAGALGLSCVIALGSMAGCGSSKEKEKTDGKELSTLVRKSRAAGMKVETVHSGIQPSNHTLKNA